MDTPLHLYRSVVAGQVLVALGSAQPPDRDPRAGKADDKDSTPDFGHCAEVDALELLFERRALRVRVVVELDELHVEHEGEGRRDGGHEAEEEHEPHRVLLAAAEIEGVDYEEGNGQDCDVTVSTEGEAWDRGLRLLCTWNIGSDVQAVDQNGLFRLRLWRTEDPIVHAPVVRQQTCRDLDGDRTALTSCAEWVGTRR